MAQAAYIHIPFCHHICHYCDFNKVLMDRQPVGDYLRSLEKEFSMRVASNPSGGIETIFVGGGTPTALNEEQLQFLVDAIGRHLYSNSVKEYTFEANPGDLSRGKLEILKAGGVNRLSFGVQSFNDELLQSIGRSHRAADVYKAIEEAKMTGFHNISIDLIYSLPGQTAADFQVSLKQALSLDLPHYSGYSLIIEPKTVFYNLVNRGKLTLPAEETEAEMYEILMDEMERHGREQYEISNFAVPGYESIHNLTYWNNEEYYGFGAGAHGYVNGRRVSNYGPLKKYMEPIQEGVFPLIHLHEVTLVEMMEEEMFLGLRKTEGVSLRHFHEKFGKDASVLFRSAISSLTARGLLECKEERIRLTKKGKFLGNEVFQSFLSV
ncbi:radical SAM family heme chaperone HemW [Bacillus massilinigeriensis]|uniref:radical SAM family heme chaperone HemW n=1 Tax=Bacillus mediterraneensis TaxID=1805474 RepID=UPI0008F89D56|nr:radical SAM family heme chaperone HemW [Bacillus mediterraneensis]